MNARPDLQQKVAAALRLVGEQRSLACRVLSTATERSSPVAVQVWRDRDALLLEIHAELVAGWARYNDAGDVRPLEWALDRADLWRQVQEAQTRS